MEWLTWSLCFYFIIGWGIVAVALAAAVLAIIGG